MTEPQEFEVTDYDTEWVQDFSADIGGYDGSQPICTIISADLIDADGDVYEVDRDYLIEVFGYKIVSDVEEGIAERKMEQ